MSQFTLNDIEKTVLVVQLNGKCHQVLLSPDEKRVLVTMAASLTDGLKVSAELVPIEFVEK